MNKISNNDSNGIKIIKNGPRDRKLWQFLVLKVLTKLYQLASTQLIFPGVKNPENPGIQPTHWLSNRASAT